MAEKSQVDINKILNHSGVKVRIDDESTETRLRKSFKPPLCKVFNSSHISIKELDNNFFIDPEAKKQLPDIIDSKVSKIIEIEKSENDNQYRKKRNIGIVFSGGPAPGGHNVISGFYDASKKANPDNVVYGFLMGPDGIIENEKIEITDEIVDKYRNTGGFKMIKTGRTKIDSKLKIKLSRQTCKEINLDALVIIGGDDSNTNAAFLAQELLKDNVQIIGVPKTIDGDVQVRDSDGNILCAMPFGFHSAARSFSRQISNLCSDGGSDVKYWHVCKVMGRVASHLALEVALQTHANLVLIGEDIVNYVDEEKREQSIKKGKIDYDSYGMSLRHLSRVICNCIVKRAAYGKNYGILVIPEGILEFVNEIQKFIIKLNAIIAEYNNTHDNDFHTEFPKLVDKLNYLRKLARIAREENVNSIWSTRDDDLFSDIPEFFREDLLMERDSHGNFPFSLVETEKVLMGLVKDYLKILKEKGIYKLGIRKSYYEKIMEQGGLDPKKYAKILFRNKNYEKTKYLLMKKSIFSIKTLKKALNKSRVIAKKKSIPEAVEIIYKKSIPNFQTRFHFYGYDGRGSDPTRFDCIYTYNLGYTAFNLVANGITGQMAAINNLEKDFSHWEPIGIPLAPLMHLEERKGKLALVMEKSLVDIESTAFRVVKAKREEWLAAEKDDECYRKPVPIRYDEGSLEDRPITLYLNSIGDELQNKTN